MKIPYDSRVFRPFYPPPTPPDKGRNEGKATEAKRKGIFYEEVPISVTSCHLAMGCRPRTFKIAACNQLHTIFPHTRVKSYNSVCNAEVRRFSITHPASYLFPAWTNLTLHRGNQQYRYYTARLNSLVAAERES
jgi:hypothetical protein